MTVREIKDNEKQNHINDTFKIPIYYNENVQKLNQTIVTDLELVKSIDVEETSIYENVFKPSNNLSLEVVKQISQHYTTDVEYLKETQQLTKNINSEELNTIHNKYNFSDFEFNDMFTLWEEIKGETGFCEKYLYIDWSFAKELNNNCHVKDCLNIFKFYYC